MNNETAVLRLHKWKRKIWFLSVALFILIASMGRIQIDTNFDFSWLAVFHSTINLITFFVLVYAYIMIRQKKIEKHRKAIYFAIGLSCTFLLSYLLYHMTVPEQKYCGTGTIRIVYLVILSSHILLSAVLLPFVMFTFARAYVGLYEMHKKMARWILPLWMYVAISGPVVYLMLSQCKR